MNPRISVLLSVYNGEKYVREAIESILHQTFKDFEVIIVDDGSTDATSSIIDSFKDPRIVRLVNEKNIGLVQSLNKGLNISKGEFIARMDADDISVADRFEKQISFLEKYPDVGVLGTAMKQVDVNGKDLSVFSPPEKHLDILQTMTLNTAIAHATVMMRRSILMSAGGYDSEFFHTEDTELWTRLIFKTKFANLLNVLYIRRIHESSIMSLHSKFQTEKGQQIRDQLFESLVDKKIFSGSDLEKIRILRNKEKLTLLKKLINKLKNILPVPLRHKLRSSTLGRMLKK